MMKVNLGCILLPLFVIGGVSPSSFRPPAIPLITTGPYMQNWMMASKATDDIVRYWDQRSRQMLGLIRIDDTVTYRFLGACPNGTMGGFDCPDAMVQTNLRVDALSTVFEFTDPLSVVSLKVTFLCTLFTDDYRLLSRPVSYVYHEVSSLDTKPHRIQLYLDATAEHVVDNVTERVHWKGWKLGKVMGVQMGTFEQNILEKRGDVLNINWGYLHLAAATSSNTSMRAGSVVEHRCNFILSGILPKADDMWLPRPANDDMPGLSVISDLGNITKGSYLLTVAYDDVDCVQFFDRRLKGYWTQHWDTIQEAISEAFSEFHVMKVSATKLNEKLREDAKEVGGEVYADLVSLAYRQTLAATKLVWDHGMLAPRLFLKEISTDGGMQTMDVIYPASPMFLHIKPDLLKLLLLPILSYANNETREAFTNVFSPHYLGTYPIADATIGDQLREAMPIENTGNMFLMLMAIVMNDPDNDYSFFYPRYWSMLTSWADRLSTSLPYPDIQLCTDDFTGKLANNTNLAIKGIIALEAFSHLCQIVGDTSIDCKKYSSLASGFAETWFYEAYEASPQPHYKIAYDMGNTYSLKYNLVWQKILKLTGPFPQFVADTEVSYYKELSNKFGTPLDNRHTYVKIDWLFWAATLAEDKASFHALVDRIGKFANSTTDRVPLTDLYDTKTGKAAYGDRAFVARPVVGAFFAKFLV